MNDDIEKILKRKIKEVERWVRDDLPRQAGKTAVDHFRENFVREGFMDGGVKKWKEVKRRMPSSGWYGFEYKGERRNSYTFARNKKTGKTRKAKSQKRLNFSKAATVRKILNGRTHELQDSIRYNVVPQGVEILSDKPYAEVQQRGRHPRVRQADGKTARTPLYRAFAGAGCENRGHHRERDGGDIEGVTPVKESRFAYVLHDDGDLLGGQQPLPGDIPRLFQRFRQPVGTHP